MNFTFFQKSNAGLFFVVLLHVLCSSAHGKYVPISSASGSNIPESGLIAILKIVPSKPTASENSNLESSTEPSDFLNDIIIKSLNQLQAYFQDNPDKDVDFLGQPSPTNTSKQYEHDDGRASALKILFYIVFILGAILIFLILLAGIRETFFVDSRTEHCIILDRLNKLESSLESISIPTQSTTSTSISLELEKREIKLRERNLIIKNLPEDEGETDTDCIKLVKNFLKDELGPEYGDIQIKDAYRLGNDRYLNSNKEFTRLIKVILNSTNERDEILRAGQDILRRKKSIVHIREDLPKATQERKKQETQKNKRKWKKKNRKSKKSN